MQIRDKRLAALIATGFGFWMCFSPPAQAQASKASATKSSDAPIVLSKFSKKKTHVATKSKSHVARAKHGAKLTDAAQRGKSRNNEDALKKLAALPSVANARAELTAGNLQSRADAEEARNLAATDDNEIVTMDGVQIASADQLNDIDRAMAEEKTSVQADEVAVAPPVPASSYGRVIKAMSSGEHHVFKNNEGNPWSSASLIGKIFVAFGSLLTLASAARLIIA